MVDDDRSPSAAGEDSSADDFWSRRLKNARGWSRNRGYVGEEPVPDVIRVPADRFESVAIPPPDPGEGFRAPQVCRIVGVTYRQLDYWARTGLVTPSLTDAAGSGTQRVYSYEDLLTLRLVKDMLDAGSSLKKAHLAVSALASAGRPWPSPDAVLVLDGGTPGVVTASDAVADAILSAPGPLVVMPLGKVRDEVDASIRSLARPAAPTAAPTPATGEPRSHQAGA